MEALPAPAQHDDVTRHDASQRDVSRHTLTIKQAAEMFAGLGTPRSPRSVQRFCEVGAIDCLRVKGEKTERYFVDPQSVERYAEELRQLESISQIGGDVTRYDASQRDMTRSDATAPQRAVRLEPTAETGRETAELRAQVDTLEKEKGQLQIDLQARVIVINQMVDERRAFIGQITELSRENGRLETQVQQLAAPKPDMSRHDATETPAEEGRGASDQRTDPPEPQRKRSIFGRLFGGN